MSRRERAASQPPMMRATAGKVAWPVLIQCVTDGVARATATTDGSPSASDIIRCHVASVEPSLTSTSS